MMPIVMSQDRSATTGARKSTQFGRKSLRLAIPLEPGFVHTVEPGIYFIPELIDLWRSQNKVTDFINYDKWRLTKTSAASVTKRII